MRVFIRFTAPNLSR